MARPGGPLRLRVLPLSAGSVEWRVEKPSQLLSLGPRWLALGFLLVALPAACAGLPWQHAAALGAAAAAVAAALHALLAVRWESLTYVRLLGVRLETRRRCGLGGTSHFVPLRQLEGLLIHEDVSTTRADFYLALPLRAADGERSSSVSPSGGRPADGGSSSGAALRQRRHGGGGAARGASTRCLAAEGGREVDVVFPSLRPRLSLLRQVYQQLSPLLAADLESLRQGGDVPGGGGGAPADQGLPPLSPLREEEVEESEVQ